MSTIIPASIALIQAHVPQLALVPWMKWVADNQLELQVGFAAFCVVLYLFFAPYRLYKEAVIAKEETEKELEIAVAKKAVPRPYFRGRIEEWITGENDSLGTLLFVQIALLNQGDPSPAEQFVIKIETEKA